jgi:hypothetical protein
VAPPTNSGIESTFHLGTILPMVVLSVFTILII